MGIVQVQVHNPSINHKAKVTPLGVRSQNHRVNEPAPTQEEQEACHSYEGPDTEQKKPCLSEGCPSSVALSGPIPCI